MSNTTYRAVETGDGTLSLHSELFDQLMHTSDGAYTEALHKHVIPSGVLEKKSTISVLDVGFGIGYNPLALLDAAMQRKTAFVEIVSLEYDRSALPWIESIAFNDYRDEYFSWIREGFRSGCFENDVMRIQFYFDDARRSVQTLREKEKTFDAVFQDPFSPAKNPELWSVDYFKIIAQLMTQDARLTTYSAALQVRGALVEAGLHVADMITDSFHKRGTIAARTPFTGSFDERMTASLLGEIKATPYRDTSLTGTREEIIAARSAEMKEKRLTAKDGRQDARAD